MSDHAQPVQQAAPPPGDAPPYTATAHPYAVAARPKTNGVAIAAFVLGLLGFSIPALICGYIGRNQIDRSGGREEGRWMATTGIVLGWVVTGLYALVFVLMVVVAASSSGY
jgi:hypothetical protein